MAHIVHLVETNPNDVTGGAGTIAGPQQDPDSIGPYFVWPGQEFDNGLSPHAVVAASEVRLMYKMLLEHESGANPAGGGGEATQLTDYARAEHRTQLAIKQAEISAVLGYAGPTSREYDLTDPQQFAEAFKDLRED